MKFLPDTNVIIAVARHNDRAVARKLIAHRTEIALSSIVEHELVFGAYVSDRASFHLGTIDDLHFQRVPFDCDDARAAAEVRATLRRAGTPIGPYDLLIAGQALARDLTVVTANVREFTRVVGLRVVDWTD